MSHYLLDEDANIGLEDYLVVDFSNSYNISIYNERTCKSAGGNNKINISL